jgi:hypothetical protein
VKSEILREQDRERVENVIVTYLITQRDRGVLDEDIVTVLDKVKQAVLDQSPATLPAAA